MRIYLVHSVTKSFYAGDGNWVADERYALSFGSCITALNLATQLNLKNVAILLAFDNRRYNLVIPMEEAGARTELSAQPNKRTRQDA